MGADQGYSVRQQQREVAIDELHMLGNFVTPALFESGAVKEVE